MKPAMNLKLLNPRHYRSCRRYIFSKTGRWDPELTLETKLEIEQHWQQAVASLTSVTEPSEDRTRTPDEALGKSCKSKFYCLAMFPYPSGSLHMGHVRVYTISDAIARFHRMNGKRVIHPMGWDAFGLPAENAARDRDIDPAVWTRDNILAMKQQLTRLGFCFDWDREVNTSNPEYYVGTQRIFLELWKDGLVYQDQSLVNWDPVDKTVLADEQVDSKGLSWRSGAKVEKKMLKQWFIRTTKFARALLDGLDNPLLQDWKDITQLQKHWIGNCDGTMLTFPLVDGASQERSFKVWTDHPEEPGLFIAISKSHPLNISENLSENQPCPEVALVLKMSAWNPLHGATLPVIVYDKSEIVRDDCGYMGVTGNEADAELSQQLQLSHHRAHKQTMSRKEALKKAKTSGIGGELVSSHLRDWLISRQRRWGTPIPLIHCIQGSCGVVAVPDSELPVKLPPATENLETWKCTTCPSCGGPGERETDTMDTFVDSSWYFLRYLDPQNSKKPFEPTTASPYMPVDLYVGGKEHAVLHLYYARFMGHFLHSKGWLREPEPFKRLLVQGMVMGKTYQVKSSGKYLSPDEVDLSGTGPREKGSGAPVVEGWEKMSKSKYNGTDPGEVLKELGCDATRLLLLADVAPTSHRKWSRDTYPGILNWQHRLWLTVGQYLQHRHELAHEMISGEKPEKDEDLEEELEAQEVRLWDCRNFYICGTSFNFEGTQQLSVAVTKLQGLTNSLRRTPKKAIARSIQYERCLAAQIVMLAPMAPHFASELWEAFTSVRPMHSDDFDWNKPVLEQEWPKLDKEYMLELLIKVNYEDVKCIKVPQSALNMDVAGALQLALAEEEVYEALGHHSHLQRSRLDVRPKYDMTLHLFTAKQEDDGDSQEKKKKKKKKFGKQKKLRAARA